MDPEKEEDLPNKLINHIPTINLKRIPINIRIINPTNKEFLWIRLVISRNIEVEVDLPNIRVTSQWNIILLSINIK